MNLYERAASVGLNHIKSWLPDGEEEIETINLEEFDSIDIELDLLENELDLGGFYNKYLLDWTTDHIQDNGKITLNLSEYLKRTLLLLQQLHLRISPSMFGSSHRCRCRVRPCL